MLHSSMRHRLTLAIIVSLWVVVFPPVVFADPTTTIEQQIEIINQEYSTTNTTAQPVDNSLGLIHWDGTKYSDETVYFEAIIYCNACNGGNKQAVATLYTDTGTAITNATVSTQSTGYQLVRSGDITTNLTNDEEYTVRLARDAPNGTAFIKAARLVVVQSGTSITGSLTQIELGDADTTTNTGYELTAAPVLWLYDAEVLTAVQNIYFESTMVNSNASGTSYAALSSSSTCATTVTGTEVTVTGTTWDRARSADIESNLSDNTVYWICLKTTSGDTNTLSNTKVIIEQLDANGIHKLQLHHTMVNQAVTESIDSYTNQAFPLQFTPSNFNADSIQAFFEIDLSTSGAEAFGRLFNTSDGTSVTGSEQNTLNASLTRLRSDNLFSALPTATKNLDTQIRNAVTDTTTATNSWLILNVERYVDPELSFSLNGVSSGQVNNDITTSVTSQYNQLPFEHLTVGTPKYAAHALYASTNASSGYTVTMSLLSYIQGLYPANNIDPFTSSWSSPTFWSSPNGATPNDNTGWIGANTTDSRVTGWSGAAQKFGAVTNSPQTVMYSTTADSGTTVYVTYVLEVNILQPADEYSGMITYQILPTY